MDCSWAKNKKNQIQSAGLNGRDSSQFVERRARNGKVVDSRFDSPTGNASLCPWERHFTLFPIDAKQSSRCGGQAWWKTWKRSNKSYSALGWLDSRRMPASYAVARFNKVGLVHEALWLCFNNSRIYCSLTKYYWTTPSYTGDQYATFWRDQFDDKGFDPLSWGFNPNPYSNLYPNSLQHFNAKF